MSGVIYLFIYSGEKKSANAILRAREDLEGGVIAWGTHNSAPGHAQSLFFQKHQSIFLNLLTNGMNVVPARKKIKIWSR